MRGPTPLEFVVVCVTLAILIDLLPPVAVVRVPGAPRPKPTSCFPLVVALGLVFLVVWYGVRWVWFKLWGRSEPNGEALDS